MSRSPMPRFYPAPSVPPGSPPRDARAQLDRARLPRSVVAAHDRLASLVDSLIGSRGMLDLRLLKDLGRFLDEEGYAAAEAYEVAMGACESEPPAGTNSEEPA